MILNLTKNIIILTISIVLVAFIIWLTLHLYQGYREYSEPIYNKNIITCIEFNNYKPQSGDIVLFTNNKKPDIFVKNVAFSVFTHVAIVYCNPKDNKNYIMESDAFLDKIFNPLDERIRWYQQHRGEIFIRPLLKPLTTIEQKRFDDFVQNLFKNNELKHHYNDQPEKPSRFKEVRLPYFRDWICNYALNKPQPLI